MRILIACEESQTVCIEMRKLGHEAYSCDIQECSGGHPEWHIRGDALELLKMRWDMIIAHPPCTYLSNAGSVNLRRGGILNEERMEKAREAKKFFLRFLEADCTRIAVENPVPGRIHGMPPYDQIIEPYYFGDPWKKRTCLWLKGLPPLFATELVEPQGLWCGSTSLKRDPGLKHRYAMQSHRSSKIRSKTFPGIARAMAEQWAGKCEERTDNQ